MEDMINLEERAYKLHVTVAEFCKELKAEVKCDMTLAMEVIVLGTQEDLAKISDFCCGKAKISKAFKIGDGYYKIVITINE